MKFSIMYLRSVFYIVVLATFSSCSTILDESDQKPIESTEMPDFHFPEAFDFQTSQELTLSFDGPATGRYEITYEWQGEKEGVVSLTGQKEMAEVQVQVPKGIAVLEVTYITGNSKIERTFSIGSTGIVSIAFPTASGRTESCLDRLYAVEGSFGGFWEIDLHEGNYAESQLSNLQGGGSIACALDQENDHVYYNVGRTLNRYDVQMETFETVFTSNPFNGSYPRFEYRDGYFYMGNNKVLFKVDAASNQIVQRYDITGFVNSNSGGDLAFASDGTLYLACFSGLYRFDAFDDDGGTATISRISAENFPYQLTSMAIDREDQIYVATNESNSRLIRMNLEDGSFEIVRQYNHKINDLTAWRCAEEDLEAIDSDGDGVIDALDDYPEDAEISATKYTPSELGQGCLAFEDMWPAIGDYDFNDLVVHYKYIQYLNPDNKTVRMKMIYDLVAMGATFHNGFGIELPTDQSKIESVTGYEVGSGINLDQKGLENGQTNPVIIVFDDAFEHLGGNAIVNTKPDGASAPSKRFEVLVEFVEPLELAEVRTQQFNPFIFIGQRSKELHLRNRPPTDLADDQYIGAESDNSNPEQGKYYRSVNNAPWGIDIIHAFRYPKESRRIDRAYNRFMDWANAEGAQHQDWYTDATGNRNTEHIYD
ncbi:MAG: LruC domain-containing protein [Cytophagales bacterium]|nr:LruC domain-containing protein [Cytophagales bacterium]